MGKTNRKILIDFDSLFDLKFGFVMFMVVSNENLYRHYDVKHHEDDIKSYLYNRFKDERMKSPVFIPSILHINNEDIANRLYGDVIKEQLKDVLEFAPKIPSVERIIRVYENPEYSNLMTCHILIRHPDQIAIVKKLFPNCTIIERYKQKNFDYSQYSRIIIGGYDNLEDIQDVKFIHITVLSYPENFQLIPVEGGGNAVMIDPKALSILGIANEFELIDPFISKEEN